MKNKKENTFKIGYSGFNNLFFLLIFFLIANPLLSQVNDTIANWDGINVEWVISASSGETVENPNQQGVNPSSNCFEVTTSENAYDLILTDFSIPVDFEEFPIYRVKILAPSMGGSILLKFENSDNTSWVEIEKTPSPGEWNELEFDFSGTSATDYARMVIFFDFLGTTPDKPWLLDDVIRVSSSNSIGLTTHLPIIIINTNGVEIPDEPKISGTMAIIDNGPGELNNQYDTPNDFNGHIGIEIRGQSSQIFPKKSYGVETRDAQGDDLDASLLGMPVESDWVLYAPYTDKSMLRNFITFYMGSKLEPYCSRMAYCEVIVNNDYKGVYILMEKIKKNENRVNIGKLKPDEIAGDDLTGGYIVKVDKIDPGFVFGTDGWKSIPAQAYPNAMNIIFQYYYPKVEDIVWQQKNYIEEYISTSENALTYSNFKDPDEGYNKYFNTSSFVDQMILNEVSKEVDAYRYSTFFYKQKDSDGGKLFAGPAWDFNLGYSNVDYWPPGIQYTGWMYPLVEPYEYGIMFWWKRLMEDPYFKNLFYTRWHQLRENELTNAELEFAIDSVVNYIDAAQQRNYNRWPILGEYVWPNYDWQGNDYNDEVEFFRTWLFNRVEWIDNNISGSLLVPSAELSNSFPELKITLSDDYFNRPILKNEDFVLNNAPSGLNIESVNYSNAAQATITLSGNTDEAYKISVTIKSGILNGFNDITTNEMALGTDDKLFIKPKVEVYSNRNILFLKCSKPQLLGEQVEIFNPSGQLIRLATIEHIQLNRIDVNLIQGIYFCRYQFDGKTQTQKLVFSD